MPSFPRRRESRPVGAETDISSFPRKWESRFVGFQSFPINSCNFEFLDSRLRGNDGRRHFRFPAFG
ncbi:hypothetical protein B2G52_06410 [Neisseria lactamica]|uniref:PilS cassette n=1 Tax=Neisseria lactamica TaxID=486 RepID=A0AAU8VGK7_NEILA|nr:hypothetical protein B2G52_06410 [Neisseria lactamica]